jgi:hypothetical protein
MYTVFNNCGGAVYCGKSLDKAIKAAGTEYFAEPYVCSAKGKRPVVENDDGSLSLGKYGQSYEDLKEELCDWY